MEKYLKWDIDLAILEAKRYKNRSEFSKFSSRAYEILRRNNLLNIGCEHMIIPYGTAIKWNKN